MRAQGRHRPRGSGGAFWTSYADMMAGLMLIFGLVMVFSIYQFAQLENIRTLEQAEQQEALTAKQIELDKRDALLTSAQSLAQTQKTTLDEQAAQLNASALTLAAKEAELEQKDQQLQAAQGLIDAAQISLQAQREQLDTQTTQLANQQALMDAQQQRIDALVGVRTQIIASLSDELRGANLDVKVDEQTGAITMTGAVLFDVNKSVLKPGGMSLLDSFIPMYVRTLLAGGYKDYVAEIIIEGHTDTDGSFLDNLKLSQDRAYAVAQYCLQDGFGALNAEERGLLRTILTANGRSWSTPVRNADGSVNKEASRRVEFKFRLKEAEMINEMRTIMESPPQTPIPTGTD